MRNLLLNADCYKHSHYNMIDPNIEYNNIYFESRGGLFKATLFFGLQYIIKEYLVKGITKKDIQEAFPLLENIGTGYHKDGWNYILKHHKGKLPIVIEAVKEGTLVPTSNVLFQVRNTDPNLPWLPSFLETLLMRVWYPTTVATLSFYTKMIFKSYAKVSSESEFIDYHLNDFGSRGVSSYESSALGGAGHLINFKGSDNLPALMLLKDYYNYIPQFPISVPATEHFVMTSMGREKEYETAKRIIESNMDNIVSIVIASYNDENFLDFIGNEMKSIIEKRTAPLILRPDSRSPIEAIKLCFNKLEQYFGSSLNSKGYKVLPPYLKIIQGDGIDYNSINDIIRYLIGEKISIDNIIFGQGGSLLQGVNRDTQKFAIKCSQVKLNDGTYRDVYKSPMGDKSKRSKQGQLALIHDTVDYRTVRIEDIGNYENLLKPVFLNGELLVDLNFSEIRVDN